MALKGMNIFICGASLSTRMVMGNYIYMQKTGSQVDQAVDFYIRPDNRPNSNGYPCLWLCNSSMPVQCTHVTHYYLTNGTCPVRPHQLQKHQLIATIGI